MELLAPSRWQRMDFISDLHLHAADAATVQAWSAYLECTCADAVFILGDLFEVWVGDDALTQVAGFEAHCADLLRAASRRMDIFIMAGNRDFLMGPVLMQAAGTHWLEDPCMLAIERERWVLSHGDALCQDDLDYMEFRARVRGKEWQIDFLSKPLTTRLELARQLREKSQAQQRSRAQFAEVSTPAARDVLQREQATVLVHGHTHRPATHALGNGQHRVVLSDWDLG
ncbi:MAG: UDP-2,3-diacylglucosamine diphosphatase, partial [Rhodoferax sp.]|nr:UDP-2,3-diacylglucosamine diphosphatase [Rhodoferax sp.]